MTTTLTKPGRQQRLSQPQQARLPGKTRPAMIALAVTMIAVAIFGTVVLYAHATRQRQVLALAATVGQGQQVTAADLRAVGIAGGTGLTTIPASSETSVSGEYATTTLIQGTLLAPGELTSTQVPGPGQFLIPVQLKQGQLPARGMTDGTAVIITPVQASQSQTTQPALAQPVQATTEEVSQPDQDGMVTVDLLVPAQYATQVAQQAAAQGIALLVAPPQNTKG